jgi:hypothetical protein
VAVCHVPCSRELPFVAIGAYQGTRQRSHSPGPLTQLLSNFSARGVKEALQAAITAAQQPAGSQAAERKPRVAAVTAKQRLQKRTMKADSGVTSGDDEDYKGEHIQERDGNLDSDGWQEDMVEEQESPLQGECGRLALRLTASGCEMLQAGQHVANSRRLSTAY